MPYSKIQIESDKNILKLVSQKKDILVYEYVKSKSKMGELLVLTQVELDKMIRMEICKPLN